MRKTLLIILSATWFLSCEKPSPDSQPENRAEFNTILALRDTTLPNGISYNEIYSLSEEGTNVYRVSTLGSQIPSPLAEPHWGPGGKIIFGSHHESVNQMVYSMNTDGSGVTRLTDGNDYHFELNVSLTSGRILYRNSDAIRSRKLDGTDEKTLTTAFVHFPSWHPDGQRVIYASDAFLNGPGWNNIFIANYDGTNTHQITHTANRVYAYPYVSPNGKLLSYMVGRKIYVANIDGTVESLLDTQYEPVYRLRGWTSDSKQLLVDGDGGHFFYLLKADGTGLKKVGSAGVRFYSLSIK